MPDGSGDPGDWFARHFHGVQTTTPSSGPDNPVIRCLQEAPIHHNRPGTIRLK